MSHATLRKQMIDDEPPMTVPRMERRSNAVPLNGKVENRLCTLRGDLASRSEGADVSVLRLAALVDF
jgi:hypothetical protein